MKENIEEDIILKIGNPQNVDLITLLRQFKREGIENFIVLRKNNFDNILSDYKRLQEEFKQVDHECETLEQKELRLEKENEELKKQNYDLLRKLKNRVKEVRKLEKYSMYKKEFSTLNKKVNELQKENEELKKFITEGITIEPNSPYKNYRLDFLRENFIPVQKLKDKIEELEAELKFEITEREARLQINLLKSLLEGEI